MKTPHLLMLLIVLSPSIFFAKTNQKTMSILSQEDCDFSVYAPVTGKDKHCYLNKCWADKKGIKVHKEGYKKKNYKKEDVYTWPIEDVCIPSAKEQPTLKNLEDGTFLYTYTDRAFRGTPNRCKCLPASTLIATPSGEIAINLLKESDIIFSVNAKGDKIEVPVKLTNKVLINTEHEMIMIELMDGRKLQVTPEHPSAIVSKSIDQFEVGDEFDGSTIAVKTSITYLEEYTYDILPASVTGYYWANGFLIGSTLFTIDKLLSESK